MREEIAGTAGLRSKRPFGGKISKILDLEGEGKLKDDEWVDDRDINWKGDMALQETVHTAWATQGLKWK